MGLYKRDVFPLLLYWNSASFALTIRMYLHQAGAFSLKFEAKTKWLLFCSWYFQFSFLAESVWVLNTISLNYIPYSLDWNLEEKNWSWNNGLVHNRQEAIISTNATIYEMISCILTNDQVKRGCIVQVVQLLTYINIYTKWVILLNNLNKHI